MEKTQVLSWILWNLEQCYGSSVAVVDVYKDYQIYCSELKIVPATSNTFGKTLHLVFPSVRNMDLNGTHKYVNVRKNTTAKDSQYTVPEYCISKEAPGSLDIFVPTQDIRNETQIWWSLRFSNSTLQVFCMDNEVPLYAFGISAFAPLRGPFVSAAITAVQYLRVCKGAEWCKELEDVPDTWTVAHDANSVYYSMKSPSCAQFVSLLGKSQTCDNCRKFRDRRMLKRKRDNKENDCIAVKEPQVKEVNQDDQADFEKTIKAILPDAPEGFITLMKSQVRNNAAKNKDPRHRRWDPEIISMSLSLWCRSPRAYSTLKECGMLVLPSERLLRYYKNCVRQQPGLEKDNLEWMKSEAERRNLSIAGYHGGLLIDEMSVQDDLQIEQDGDLWKVTGAVDMGHLGNDIRTTQHGAKRMKMATHVLQVLFHGFTGFCWPVAYYASDSADSTQLATIIWEISSALDDLGFTVDYIMTDGASSNRGLFNLLCNGNARQEQYLCADLFDVDHKISLVQDPKHCIKKVRNSVSSSKLCNTGKQRKLELNGKFIAWDHWEKAHHFNQSLGIMKYAALSDDHIYLTNELKMRNHLAEQVLNKDMLLLMITYKNTLPAERQADLDGTIAFLRCTSELVSLFCDEHLYVTSTGHKALATAQSVMDFFLQWENSTPAQKQQRSLITREAREDITSALHGFMYISKVCLDFASPLKSGSFNSDLIENFFCQQRGISHGLNTNPTIAQYGPGVNAIILGQGCVSKKCNSGKTRAALPVKTLKPSTKLNKSKKIRV